MMFSETISNRETLYGGLAESLMNLIDSGTFREGDKVPSIRTMSRQFGVSVNTVREAYWVLETQQILESRPQSGYFVRQRSQTPSATSGTPDLTGHNPHEVLPCSLREDLGAMLDGRPFQGLNLARGSADVNLLPSRRLNAFLGAVSREAGDLTMDYDTTKGLPELREAIARHSLEAGIRLAPDDFVIMGGCLQAVNIAVQVLCKPGDTVAVEAPTYSEFLKLFKQRDLKVLEIPTSPRDGMNLEVLEWVLDKHEVKAVLTIANFNNPAGFQMPEHRKKALVELLARRAVPLIEDDAYGDLSFLDHRPAACKAFDTTGNVLYCSSVSKTLAPGYRVGWIAAGRWQEEIIQWKLLASAAASLPTQMAVARFFREGNFPRYLRTLRRTLTAQAKALGDVVARSFPLGTVVHPPLGGLFLWVELPEPVDTEALYSQAVREGVFFRPGIVFSASGKFRRHLRLCFGTWNSEIAKAAARLGALACTMAGVSETDIGKVS